VPQALAAAGLVIAFGSIYAAYALYELVAPLVAFAGLAALGLGALALSLRQGPLIAALGLIGSYVTPSLIPSPDPNAWSFFPYLLVILAASFAVLRRRTWWWLGFAAIAGSALWALLWLKGGPFEMADIAPVGLFAGTVVLAFGQALAFPALMTLAVNGAPANERSSVVGTFTAFTELGFAIGALSLGVIASAVGYDGVFVVCAIGPLIGALLLARIAVPRAVPAFDPAS